MSGWQDFGLSLRAGAGFQERQTAFALKSGHRASGRHYCRASKTWLKEKPL